MLNNKIEQLMADAMVFYTTKAPATPVMPSVVPTVCLFTVVNRIQAKTT